MGIVASTRKVISSFFQRRRIAQMETKQMNGIAKLSAAPPNMTSQQLHDLQTAIEIYSGNPRWLKDIADDAKHAGYGAVFPQKIARLVLTRTEIIVKNPEINPVIQDHVMPNLHYKLEQGIALNGLAMKPFYSDVFPVFNDDGTVKAWDYEPQKIKVAFYLPDAFLVDKTDSAGDIQQIRFFTSTKQGDKYYILVELHKYDEASRVLEIHNTAFRATGSVNAFLWQRIGEEVVPLGSIEAWKHLTPYFRFEGVEGVPAGVFYPVTTDNVCYTSMIGRAGNVRAADPLRVLDVLYYALSNEIDLTAIKMLVSEQGIDNLQEAHKNTWRGLNKVVVPIHTAPDSEKIFDVFAPDIRHNAYGSLLEGELRRAETLWQLSHGEVSEVQGRARTATETNTLRGDTLSTKENNQAALSRALVRLVYAIQFWQHIGEPRKEVMVEFIMGTPIRPVADFPHIMNAVRAGMGSRSWGLRTHFGYSKTTADQIVEEAAKEEASLQEARDRAVANEQGREYDFRLEGDTLIDAVADGD